MGMPAKELTALCETAARLKYLDNDLFSEAYKQIANRIRAGEFDSAQITSVATAMVDLNAYDAAVFSAAARFMVTRVNTLSKEQRLHWVKLIQSSGHKGDIMFITA